MDSGAKVAIDVPAGPSEVLVRCSSPSPLFALLLITIRPQIIADKTADPVLIASDLLGQQEHGLDSQSVLVTIDCDDSYVQSVLEAVAQQAAALPRSEILRKSLSQSFILQTASIEQAFAFSNDYAPEHLLVYTENSSSTLDLIENAGSVFLGPWSPVACVDSFLFTPLLAVLTRAFLDQLRRLRLWYQPHPPHRWVRLALLAALDSVY